VQKLDPKSDGAARDWVAIYDECNRILYEEIDYRMEANYAEEFRANFADISWVKVPTIDKSLLAADVLVMEYVPGAARVLFHDPVVFLLHGGCC
jgi:predicted unusual protein kinase regulating ubiquinone biosynthesis (AarF/ABC1/UbiB family)